MLGSGEGVKKVEKGVGRERKREEGRGGREGRIERGRERDGWKEG